jgi:hypothetical protein
MKKISIVSLLFLAAILLIYRNWLLSPEIIGGDWPYFFPENIKAFSFLPPPWDSTYGNGFGGSHVVYALDSYLYFTGWFFSDILKIPWPIVYKFFWFGMALALSIYSIYYLIKKSFPLLPKPCFFMASFLYITNTYILLVLGGGQIGVGLGYAIAPLVLAWFIQLIDKPHVRYSLLAGLLFALHVLFDFRIAYITMAAIVLYYLLQIKWKSVQKNTYDFLLIFIIPLCLTVLLHMFWLLPFFFIGQQSVIQLGSAYTSPASVKFLSFAQLENTIGLLHPNWPENIFGKVGFMRPEFLLLPLIVFSSLLFLNQKGMKVLEKKKILFFALTALLAIFLAKGANDPFGNIYLWLFQTIPGFIMFRDPTKWYTLIALSYSVLIPVSLYSAGQVFKSKVKIQKYLPGLLVLTITAYLLFLIQPAVLGKLSGTFETHKVPAEYERLKNILTADNSFSRTLWMPRFQRFGYNSENHPAVEEAAILDATNSAEINKTFKNNTLQKKLADLSINYIIVPYDSEQEIFLKDRKYNPSERKKIVATLDKTPWLHKDLRFKHLAVYRLNASEEHIFLENNEKITYKKLSSTSYTIDVTSQKASRLIFNENYSPYWILNTGSQQITSKNYHGMNSFSLPLMQKEMTLTYSLSTFYVIGRVISIVTLISILFLLFSRKR